MGDTDKKELIQKIDKALDDVRPHLAVDGGDVEVVGVTEEMMVQIKWLGTCENCSMSTMTMKAGVEQAIKGRVPQITGVVAVNGVNV
ncbi:MAG: NifU family protein [Bacteroidetes bacterium]|nr:NifU family protein [Bacteroidota bacterium]